MEWSSYSNNVTSHSRYVSVLLGLSLLVFLWLLKEFLLLPFVLVVFVLFLNKYFPLVLLWCALRGFLFAFVFSPSCAGCSLCHLCADSQPLSSLENSGCYFLKYFLCFICSLKVSNLTCWICLASSLAFWLSFLSVFKLTVYNCSAFKSTNLQFRSAINSCVVHFACSFHS